MRIWGGYSSAHKTRDEGERGPAKQTLTYSSSDGGRLVICAKGKTIYKVSIKYKTQQTEVTAELCSLIVAEASLGSVHLKIL